MQDGGDPRVGRVRVRRHEPGQGCGLRVAGRDDHRARARSRQAAAILRIGQKCDGALARGIERGDPVDDYIAIARELGAAALGELAQRNPDSVW